MSSIRGQRTKLPQQEKNKFLKERRKLGGPLAFKKASDDDLRNATKFIAASNMSKLATRYLGLTSQQILGRNVFNVLKMWRDAMPYHGSKQVSVEITKLLYKKQIERNGVMHD